MRRRDRGVGCAVAGNHLARKVHQVQHRQRFADRAADSGPLFEGRHFGIVLIDVGDDRDDDGRLRGAFPLQGERVSGFAAPLAVVHEQVGEFLKARAASAMIQSCSSEGPGGPRCFALTE